jgi:glyoxylase-like metal-dependent hydrolase (beta-lactamase superfamily II)
MQNFVYLVGDEETREALVVDPAWDVDGIVACAQADGYRIAGALVTHWHPDHVGGPLMGHDVQGLARLLAVAPCPIHVHAADAELVKLLTGVSDSDLKLVSSGDKVRVGAVEVECLHTPGHTAGSQCFRCGQALISGDTLFLEGCGRTDLPGGDAQVLARSLGALMSLPSELVLYPGHDYSDRPSAPLEEVKRTNPVLQGFLRRFGAA